MANNNSGSLFGQPAASKPATTGGLFGNTTATTTSSPNPFGGGSATSAFGNMAANSTGNVFGAASNAPSSGWTFAQPKDNTTTTNLFGSSNSASTTQPSTSGFFGSPAPAAGSTTPNKPLLFGNPSTTPAGPPPDASKSLFGGTSSSAQPNLTSTTTAPTKNLFGNLNPNNNAASTSQQAPSLFGAVPANKSAPPLFGAPASNSAPQEKPSIFGTPSSNSNQSTANIPGPLSGSSTPQSKPSNLFDSTPAQPASSGLFGNKSNENTNPGNKSPSKAELARGLFGPPATSSASQPTSSLFTLAGDDASKPSDGAAAKLFGFASGAGNPATSASGDKPSLFGTPSSTSALSGGLFAGLGQKKDLTPSSTADASKSSAQPATSLFGAVPMQKEQDADVSKAGTSSASPFTLGKPTATSSSSSPFTLGKPATTSSSSSPFTLGKATSDADKSAQPATSATTAPTSASTNLGGSTSGPPPTAQSRLKNKSMDDIITRWASDLSKYQKEFQAQAEKVASWDRMLVENGNAISKLYSKTFQAERDTAEVQKQLSAVEGHQDELEQWLERYEREVDDIMSRQAGQGEGLQGPDQERERTYKTAEKISDKLNDMGKDLTSMIDEINSASAAISKTSKPDDPLSQIVRVLNGHLSQLQLIDQGTSELQAKVNAARNDSQRIGSRKRFGFGSDTSGDFYQAYMNRN